MHSRVFQISEKPIEIDDYYSEWRYDEPYMMPVADYVTSCTNEQRELSIKWLADCLKGVAVRDGDKFTITNKIKYFENRYEQFKKCIDLAASINLNQYAGDEEIKGQLVYSMDSLQFRIDDSISDKYGFYVDIDYPYPFDEHMRYLKDGDSFYIGAVFDYHS